MAIRKVSQAISGRQTIDGAGVKLYRVFSHGEVADLDPFLLLDNFGSDNPLDYLAGFPWHPHRGIETVTYMLKGEVEHADNLGNKGTIHDGEVQWMTAGSGIIHQEMPKLTEGRSVGFQLWVNLPAKDKMCSPKYRDVKAGDIPIAKLSEGVSAKIICGKAKGVSGPVHDLAVEVEYLDISMEPGKELHHSIKPSHTAFAYVYAGEGMFGENSTPVSEGKLALFGKGDAVRIKSGKAGLRFLLVSGAPLREPISWGGPIVMNTEEELRHAFEELQDGTFIKGKANV